jgi:hypothetical protein
MSLSGMPLLDLMTAVEGVVRLIEDLTCKAKNTDLQLSLLPPTRPRHYTFKVARGDRAITLAVHTGASKLVRSCVASTVEASRKVADLGDLRNCISGHLVPSMRALNVLKSLMQEHLHMVYSPKKKRMVLRAGEEDKMLIWLSKDEDSVKLSMGDDKRVYPYDKLYVGSERLFFYEDPFAMPHELRKPALTPATMGLVSYVMGIISLDNLKIWEQEPVGEAWAEPGAEPVEKSDAPHPHMGKVRGG